MNREIVAFFVALIAVVVTDAANVAGIKFMVSDIKYLIMYAAINILTKLD